MVPNPDVQKTQSDYEPQDAVSLEQQKFLLDQEIRRREIAIKEREARRSSGLSASTATIAAGIIALVSGGIGAKITALSSENIEAKKSEIEMRIEASKQAASALLERQKFESTLILQAIKTPNRSDAVRNLKFFVSAGFIKDENSKVSSLSDEELPSISEPSSQDASIAVASTGRLNIAKKDGSNQKCTGVAINKYYVVTADFCVEQEGKITFDQNGTIFDLLIVKSEKDARISILKIADHKIFPVTISVNSIREPVEGESIYLATTSQYGASKIANCKVVARNVNALDNQIYTSHSFGHSCHTDPGSAGAAVLAVSDNALLGIHYASFPNGSMEIASSLSASAGMIENLIAIQKGAPMSAH